MMHADSTSFERPSVVNSSLVSAPIMCSSPTSLNASACDSSVNTDIDSTVRRFIAVGISTNERLLRRRLRSVALHARRSAPEATAKGRERRAGRNLACMPSLRSAPNPEPPERGRSGGLTPPPRPPAAALRRARPPGSAERPRTRPSHRATRLQASFRSDLRVPCPCDHDHIHVPYPTSKPP